VVKDNDDAVILLPSLSDGPSGRVFFISKPKNGLKVIQLAIYNFPESKQHISQNDSIKLVSHKQNFLNDFMWFSCVNLVKIALSLNITIQSIKSNVFFIINVNSLRMRRIEVGSDGFENFVIDESVVDVALKIVGFV
jgi:hypothetical protein